VANVEPRVIQQLLAQVEDLEKEIKGVGPVENKSQQCKVDEIRSAVIGGATFDPSRWSELSADKQSELSKQLTLICDKLLDVSRRNDARPPTLEQNGVSRQSIIWLAIFGFIFAATLLSLVR
jgi:hypothetical protein